MTTNLMELPVGKLLQEFGKGGAAPGSGSAAALLGLLSANLIKTVISLTKEPKRTVQYGPNLSRLLKIESDVNERLLPKLESLFQEDFEQFDEVIRLRNRRDETCNDPQADALAKLRAVDQANLALIPATERPVEIARCCLELANYGLTVFDHGFKGALGDSGVAVHTALGAIPGCLSIIELNLQPFKSDDWTVKIRGQRDAVLSEFRLVQEQAESRLSRQIFLTERRTQCFQRLQTLAKMAKGRKSISNKDIERIAIQLQKIIWLNKDLLWKKNPPDDPYSVLDAGIVLESLNFYVDRPATLGQYMGPEGLFEVAGVIDQKSRVVSISKQFRKELQNFTIAHELGHSLLHTQETMHHDRPMDGSDTTTVRGIEEHQADKFATYFLMPKKLVVKTFLTIFLSAPFKITDLTSFAMRAKSSEALRKQCKNLRGLSRMLARATFYDGVAVLSLAELFGVSSEAMAIRLEELELVEF